MHCDLSITVEETRIPNITSSIKAEWFHDKDNGMVGRGDDSNSQENNFPSTWEMDNFKKGKASLGTYSGQAEYK
jgi:hypothetical protein